MMQGCRGVEKEDTNSLYGLWVYEARLRDIFPNSYIIRHVLLNSGKSYGKHQFGWRRQGGSLIKKQKTHRLDIFYETL